MKKEKLFTIGVEEEYMICNPKSYDLIDKADEILKNIDKNKKNNFSYELLLSEIEANTNICIDSSTAIDEIIDNRKLLKTIGEEIGYCIGISGTHPTALPSDQKFVRNESYNWVTSELKEYARQNITFSTHVHIGLDSKDMILSVLNIANAWIAPLIALSSNSPFFAGLKTGMNSSRTFQFGIFPRTNILHNVTDVDNYNTTIDNLTKSKAIGKPRHLWWKIRPHFEYNTIEFRMCDIQRSLVNTKMLIDIIQALVHRIYLDLKNNKSFNKYNLEYLNDGIWKAASKGFEGLVICPITEEVITLKDSMNALLEYIYPSLVYFDNKTSLNTAELIINGNTEADDQIYVFEKSGFNGLKKFLVDNVEYS